MARIPKSLRCSANSRIETIWVVRIADDGHSASLKPLKLVSQELPNLAIRAMN